MFSIHSFPSITIPFFLSSTSITLTLIQFRSNTLIPFHFIIPTHFLFLFDSSLSHVQWYPAPSLSRLHSVFTHSFSFHPFLSFVIPIPWNRSQSYHFFTSSTDHFTVPPFILFHTRLIICFMYYVVIISFHHFYLITSLSFSSFSFYFYSYPNAFFPIPFIDSQSSCPHSISYSHFHSFSSFHAIPLPSVNLSHFYHSIPILLSFTPSSLCHSLLSILPHYSSPSLFILSFPFSLFLFIPPSSSSHTSSYSFHSFLPTSFSPSFLIHTSFISF